ncbi:hypothetical protein AC249_AIPGENE12670, partial [Exaiptasia diaphana]
KKAEQQAERRDYKIERRLVFQAFMNEHREDDDKEELNSSFVFPDPAPEGEEWE